MKNRICRLLKILDEYVSCDKEVNTLNTKFKKSSYKLNIVVGIF